MEVRHMREWVSSAYSGLKWKAHVNRMPDNQIIAIYASLVKSKKIKGA